MCTDQHRLFTVSYFFVRLSRIEHLPAGMGAILVVDPKWLPVTKSDLTEKQETVNSLTNKQSCTVKYHSTK